MAGTLLQIASCIPAFPTKGKGTLGSLLSAPASVSKRETPTSNLTESTGDYLASYDHMGIVVPTRIKGI